MRPLRATALALLTAAAVFATARVAVNVPFWWAVLVALPPAAAVLITARLTGTFDQDWTPEPDRAATSVCLHATSLTDRLGQAATDPYRFTSRVQPRLRRLALTSLRRDPATADIEDLHDPRARERLGDDLHDLLTASAARLPKPAEFAAMMRRLEEP
jgi:signal transduction histidine kinase